MIDKEKTCTACSGSGYYCGRECGACNGTGLEYSKDDIIEALEAELEKLQNKLSNRDYSKCTNEVFKYVTDNICDDGITKKEIRAILKKHFA